MIYYMLLSKEEDLSCLVLLTSARFKDYVFHQVSNMFKGKYISNLKSF